MDLEILWAFLFIIFMGKRTRKHGNSSVKIQRVHRRHDYGKLVAWFCLLYLIDGQNGQYSTYISKSTEVELWKASKMSKQDTVDPCSFDKVAGKCVICGNCDKWWLIMFESSARTHTLNTRLRLDTVSTSNNNPNTFMSSLDFSLFEILIGIMCELVDSQETRFRETG